MLMMLGALTHAGTKAQAAAAPVEAAASDAEEKDDKQSDTVIRQRGVASWYGRAWRGRRTASGIQFDDRAMTAAHRWLPFETQARVTNLQNGRSVDVVVTDRGPYHKGRIIDLSAKAAEALGIKECGIAEVIVRAQL
jgi:peptidoglycan lytic transglycosylase